MKVLLLGVTYKSYECLEGFVNSIDQAASLCSSEVEVTIAIGDNTEKDWDDINIHINKSRLLVFPYHENLGYMGCANRMIADLRAQNDFDYDYVAICNVDLQVDKNFFVNLKDINTDGVGWIAPDIFTPSRDRHENPFRKERPTKKTFFMWMLMYSNQYIFCLKEILTHPIRHGNKKPTEMDIYAGHGSFMMFSREFISKQGDLTFPSFMYAEEIFFAELNRRHGLKVRVFPSLKITNTGSVSVKLLGKGWRCKQNRRSLSRLYDLFFKEA